MVIHRKGSLAYYLKRAMDSGQCAKVDDETLESLSEIAGEWLAKDEYVLELELDIEALRQEANEYLALIDAYDEQRENALEALLQYEGDQEEQGVKDVASRIRDAMNLLENPPAVPTA